METPYIFPEVIIPMEKRSLMTNPITISICIKRQKLMVNGRHLEKLPFNKNGFSYQHPALSPDGKKLYFSSDMEGGYGGFDFIVC